MQLYTYIASKLWQNRHKEKAISAPVVKIAVGSIALGIAVMIITVSIVTGFKNEIKGKAIGFAGHILITAYTNNASYEQEPIEMNASFLKQLVQDGEIAHIQPFATKNAIIKTREENQGIIIKGVNNSYDWGFIQKYLLEGAVLSLKNPLASDEILISQTIAARLNAKTGDKLLTYFVGKKQSTDSAIDVGYEQRLRKFTVKGIYQTGFAEVDDNIVFADLRQVQKLNYWHDNMAGGFEIALKDMSGLARQAEKINEEVGQGLEARAISDIYPTLFSWLSLLDSNAFIIIALMIIVAVINMISALLILILERSNAIGLLKSLGSSNNLLQKVFLYQALKMIARGLLIGNICALILCFVQLKFKPVTLNPQSYYVTYVPVEINWMYILLVNLITIVSCLFMMLLPVLIISKITPVKALRFK